MLDSSLDRQAENKSPKAHSSAEETHEGKGAHHSKGVKTEKHEKKEKADKKNKSKDQIKTHKEPKKVCVYHKEELTLFNETCQEPVCEQCIMQGPHNSPLYSIVPIDQAYRIKTMELGQLIGVNLKAKADQLRAQEYRINYRMSEIKLAKSIIEKDIRMEYEGILSRLSAAEGQKVALLQHEMAVLQRDIVRINEIIETYFALTQSEKEKLDFMLRTKAMTENAENLLYKAFKTEIAVVPYDLPRELSVKREEEAKFRAHSKMDAFKNEVLWNMYQRLILKAQELKEVSQEIVQWQTITEKCQAESRELLLVCHFCAAKLEKGILNEDCPQNLRDFSADKCTPALPTTLKNLNPQPKDSQMKNPKKSCLAPADIVGEAPKCLFFLETKTKSESQFLARV